MRAPSQSSRAEWRRCERGAAAVEFAIIGPVLILLIVGIMSYGGYFWIAHSVQQAANDAARAAIAGLNDAERRALATATLQREIAGTPAMRAEATHVEVQRGDDSLTVLVRYDASGNVFWAFSGLLPMPSPQVERGATIRLGGY